jgi:HEAT repeat protein
MSWRRIVSVITMILSPIVLSAVFLGVLKDQWQNAPYHHLVRDLQSGDSEQRREAALELGVMRFSGEPIRGAIKPLIDRLDDPDRDVRKAVSDALRWFGPDATPAMPSLARIMRDPESDIRPEAIRALIAIGTVDASAILFEALADPDPARRVQTVEVIASCTSSATPFVSPLIDRLASDPEPSVREAILHAFTPVEPKSERVALAKIKALEDHSARVRKLAASLLREPVVTSTVPGLRKALQDENPEVRAEALNSLSQIGLSRPEAVPALCEALANLATRIQARYAIGRVRYWGLHTEAEPDFTASLRASVPALISAMESKDQKSGGVVAALICRMIASYTPGSPPFPFLLQPAMPALRARLKDGSSAFQRYVFVEVLNAFPSEMLIPVYRDLGSGLANPHRATADSAILASWQQAVTSIATRLEARDPMTTHHVLINLFPLAIRETLIPAICRALDDEDPQLSPRAVALLSNIEWKSDSGILAESATRTAVLALKRALKSPDPMIRGDAATTLGQIGAPARDALAALREAAEHERELAVKSKFEEALRLIALSRPNHVSKN